MGNNVGNQQDCARYAEVSTVAGTNWTDLGVLPGAAPAIFKLDPDTDLSVGRGDFGSASNTYSSIYRNYDRPDALNCLFFLSNSLVVENCNMSVSGPEHTSVWLDEEASVVDCFPYGLNANYTVTIGSGPDFLESTGLIVRTPEAPCSDCRAVGDAGAGALQGNYTLKDFYTSDCGADTDMCLYEKDGKEYCFQENGLYDIDFTCPA